jgi:putative tryptophan/tyrosine transport system substrate-binding protein
VVARGQQPVRVSLNTSPTEARRRFSLGPFLHGLAETGFVEGYNVATDYRWSEDKPDQLPRLAAELVRRQVALIAANAPAALAAKAATQTGDGKGSMTPGTNAALRIGDAAVARGGRPLVRFLG